MIPDIPDVMVWAAEAFLTPLPTDHFLWRFESDNTPGLGLQSRSDFKQHPRSALGLIDPSFYRARRGYVVELIAHLMSSAQKSG